MAALLGVGATSAGAPAQAAQTAQLATTTPRTAATGWSARTLPLPHGDSPNIVLPQAREVGCLPSGSCVTAVNWLAASLDDVACGTVCAAIGTVAISGKGTFPLLELGSGTTEGLLEVESGGKWRPVEAPLPAHAAGAPANPRAALTWLACPHACDAVGIYEGQEPYLSAGPA